MSQFRIHSPVISKPTESMNVRGSRHVFVHSPMPPIDSHGDKTKDPPASACSPRGQLSGPAQDLVHCNDCLRLSSTTMQSLGNAQQWASSLSNLSKTGANATEGCNLIMHSLTKGQIDLADCSAIELKRLH